MPIDKFGRSKITISGDKINLLRGPRGEGFNLTTDGNFDVGNKKISNVGNPTGPTDVVNLGFFRDALLNFSKELKEHFKRVLELSNAVEVTSNYISFQNKKRLVSVKGAKDKNDVVIKKDLETSINSLNIEIASIKSSVSQLQGKITAVSNTTNKEIGDIKLNLLDLKHQFDGFTTQINTALSTLTTVVTQLNTAVSTLTTSAIHSLPDQPAG